jgi:hypothetical protein
MQNMAAATSLFEPPVTPGQPAVTAGDALRLQDVSHLPTHARGYDRRERTGADPLGLRGLPEHRADLDKLLAELCERLISLEGRKMTGRRLVEELRLRNTRALRLLVAYGHVHHRLRAIVGSPGEGYRWGEHCRGVYGIMAGHARRMGRAWFFISTLYGKGKPAVEAAQLLLDFVGEGAAPRRNDELSALMAAEGVRAEDVVDALVESLAQTDRGREALSRVGRRHAGVLLPAETVNRLQLLISEVQSILSPCRNMFPGTPVPPPPTAPDKTADISTSAAPADAAGTHA